MFETPPPQTETKEKEKPSALELWLSSEFTTQYENRSKILNKLGLLEILPESQEIGIVGIDGKEYPYPSQESIEEILRSKKELFETKMLQGFTELSITPFALPLSRLTDTLKKQLIIHSQSGKLFHTKKNQADASESLIPFDLDKDNALYVEESYDQADENGTLVYDVKEFSGNHQGKTKQEMIASQMTMPGYLITLREKNVNIPRVQQGKTLYNRKQFETNKSPKEYLKAIQTETQYQGESGYTPEEWLTQFLTHMQETDQVMDDGQGESSASFQCGAYYPASGFVPYGDSNRGFRRVILRRNFPDFRNVDVGVRSAVRI